MKHYIASPRPSRGGGGLNDARTFCGWVSFAGIVSRRLAPSPKMAVTDRPLDCLCLPPRPDKPKYALFLRKLPEPNRIGEGERAASNNAYFLK